MTRTGRSGTPVYLGAIERNAVQSFMDMLSYPGEDRFSTRISEWYDLTSRYRKQLFELEKESYLTLKTTEHKNQVILQWLIGTDLQ
ncbi:MAG: hypothetical protein ABR903_09055 [Thermodesulfovibrionales bacterium]